MWKRGRNGLWCVWATAMAQKPFNGSLGSLEPTHGGQGVSSMDNLQREMLGALDYDQKKQQINDAKLRAVAQRVEYDDFEKLVLGAHLKPIKPKSQHGVDTSKPFDCFVLHKYEAKPVAGPAMPAASAAAPAAAAAMPKTSQEFLRAWRRQLKTPEERFAYVRKLEPEFLPTLFRTELEPATFDQIIEAMRVCVLQPATDEPASFAAHAAWTEQWLLQTSRISRFDLTLDFADKATVTTIRALLELIERDGGAEAEPSGEGRTTRFDSNTLASLRAAYKL